MLTASGRPLGRDLTRRLALLLPIIACVVFVFEAAAGLQLHQSHHHGLTQSAASLGLIGDVAAQLAGPHTHRPLNPPSSNRRVEDTSSADGAADANAESPVDSAVLVVGFLLVVAVTIGASELARPALEERIVSRGHLLRAPPAAR